MMTAMTLTIVVLLMTLMMVKGDIYDIADGDTDDIDDGVGG